MDVVVIVLLVLLGVIVLTKGKPLWNNWVKPVGSILLVWSIEKKYFLLYLLFLVVVTLRAIRQD